MGVGVHPRTGVDRKVLMQLEIVSHCWRYSRLLTYQLSSLVLFPPRNVSIKMTVFYSDEDPETTAVLNYFRSHQIPSIIWHPRVLPKNQLFRRAIGRELATQETGADWLWFADCDLCFREGTLDAVKAAVDTTTEDLLFPNAAWTSKTHQSGDSAIERLDPCSPRIIDVTPEDFEPIRYPRAIGGVQIVRGTIARLGGYCRDTRWQRPAARWKRCTCDVAFRKTIRNFTSSGWRRVELPNLFRIRHSVCGRENHDIQL